MASVLLFDGASRIWCGGQRAVARALLPTTQTRDLVRWFSHSSFTSDHNLKIHGFAGYLRLVGILKWFRFSMTTMLFSVLLDYYFRSFCFETPPSIVQGTLR